MRKASLVIAAPLLAAGIAVAGCQSHHAAENALNTPQGKQAQAIVTKCLTTSGGSLGSMEKCLAPGGTAAKAKLRTCAVRAVAEDSTSKARFEKALDLCVVNDR